MGAMVNEVNKVDDGRPSEQKGYKCAGGAGLALHSVV